VATVTRITGDLALAEDSVQDACVVAVERWPVDGMPTNPSAWLIGVARHKATDRLRREARRDDKEEAAMHQLQRLANGLDDPTAGDADNDDDDELALIYMCCHPALDPAARVALTLRAVCGLTTREIAVAFLVPEPTMAKRLVRVKHKIRDTAIPFRVPPPEDLSSRTADVLRVIYLIFTEGHRATSGELLVRDELCDQAIRLARDLHALLPNDPEVSGLLALLLLTDARRAARTDAAGDLVLLEEQDRSRWNRQKIEEGDEVLEAALRVGRPGAYQLWAAIAACHATARMPDATDWRQIALLYQELLRYEPTPVVEANRAIAVAMAEGPAAGLVILDVIANHPQLKQWPSIHIARADLLSRLGRPTESISAYRTALELEPAAAERAFIHRRIHTLGDT